MKIDEKIMQSAIVRINELQNEIKKRYKDIDGAQQYVKEQLKLYEEDSALRKRVRIIARERERIASDFFKKHGQRLEAATKHVSEMQKAETESETKHEDAS